MMWANYFAVGMVSTLGFSAALSRTADELLAAAVSVVGGVASAVVVAWLQHRWGRNRK